MGNAELVLTKKGALGMSSLCPLGEQQKKAKGNTLYIIYREEYSPGLQTMLQKKDRLRSGCLRCISVD